MGFMHAAEKFDRDRGVKFITYAGNWANQYMSVFIDNNCRTIRVPRYVADECRRSLRGEKTLIQRSPLQDIAGHRQPMN